MNVAENQFVSLLLNKGDLQISAKLLDSQGQPVFETISKSFEPVRVAFISQRSGPYELLVSSLEADEELRGFQLTVESVEVANEHNKGIAAAVLASAEAGVLKLKWEEQALRTALKKYEEAASLWQSARLPHETALTFENMGAIHVTLSEYQKAIDRYLEASRKSRASGDRAGAMRQRAEASLVYTTLGKNPEALENSSQALEFFSRSKSANPEHWCREALALNSAGEAYYSLGKLRLSIDYFNRALAASTTAGDRRGQARAYLNLGYSHLDSGNIVEARKYFDDALRLYRMIGDLRGEALTLTASGSAYSLIGEKQKALDLHKTAKSFFRTVGDHQSEAVALNSIGEAYEDLNELLTAGDNYSQALEIYQRLGNRDFEAVTKYYLGRVNKSLGKKEEARRYLQQSLQLARQLEQERVAAYAVYALSTLSGAQGHETVIQLRRGLQLYKEIGDRRGQTNTLNAIGQIYLSRGEPKQALRSFQQALPLSRKAADRHAETDTLYNIARATSDAGDPRDALVVLEKSIKIIEDLRSQVVSPELRASYFASVSNHWELYIDLLMKAHWANPDQEFAALAFQASENARARALIEMLTEIGTAIRQGVDPNLLEEERKLQQQLAAKAAYQTRLLTSEVNADEIARAHKEIRQLATAYQEIETQIRQQSPEFANLVQPQPLKLDQIQAELQDSDLLLEFSLGQERSYLWVVSSTSVTPYQLPARAEIETAVAELYELLTTRQNLNEQALDRFQENAAGADALYWQKASLLSEKLIGPIISQLGTKRLLIVSDGALQYLPFEALPVPKSDQQLPVPLVVNHEIVNLPSASVLATLRRTERRSQQAQRLIAIVADPVFEKDDPRLTQYHQRALSDAGNVSPTIGRLPATRKEAEAILAVTPNGTGKLSMDFDACRTTVMNGELKDYHVLHFATHGIIDTSHPELSGVMLSMFNRDGKNENGLLQIHDIYNLNLPNTELVVLSACKTALGKEVRKEGLVGLTRGFMYAGAKSVVASLWKVDDRATADLMKQFYSGMFEENLPPAAALRKAKIAMLGEERWRSPYFWAAFTIQGEYKNQILIPARSHARSRNAILLIAGVMAASFITILVSLKLRRTG
ncbi:MAG TPA: CHAT domain-containing tetratricopeptide repeat protein [Pyrinomonadaceae bacterium]|nr:CHAT domain-containing tetratricopeptide repeat protein [Pyrinomonadaceae bacterium]